MDAYKLETERGRKVERNKELRWYVEKQGWGMEVKNGLTKQTNGKKNKLLDINNRIVIPREDGGLREDKEGKGVRYAVTEGTHNRLYECHIIKLYL